MKLIEVTIAYPKYSGREPKADDEVMIKKAFFIPQNVVCLIEEVDKPIAKTYVALAGGNGFLVTDEVGELADKINVALALEV